MRRRLSTDPNNALDLFLDAISNVFGGLLFVALLVVVLLQMTPLTTTQPRPAATTALEDQIRQIEALAAAAGEQTDDLQPLTDRQAVLQAAIRESLAAADAARDREAEARAQLRDLQQRATEAENAVRDAQAALDAARAQRHGLVRLPQFRDTQKSEAPLMIRGGRVTALLQHDPSGEPIGLNTGAVERSGDGRRVRPRAGAGVAVTADGVADLARELTRPLSPQRHFMALAVWEDSFAEAALLRDALVAAGFEYGLVLLKAEQTIATAAEGGVQ